MHPLIRTSTRRWSWICSWFSPDLYWSKRTLTREVFPFFFRGDFQANGKWVYREHCAVVRGSVPKERLLEWAVEDGWEPLCKFLGKEVPTTEFPNGNAPAGFQKIVGGAHARFRRDAYWNMALVAGLAAVAGSAVFFKGS